MPFRDPPGGPRPQPPSPQNKAEYERWMNAPPTMPDYAPPPPGLPPEGSPNPGEAVPLPPQIMDYPGELTNPNPVTHLQYPEYYVPGGELPPPYGIYQGPSQLETANPAGYQDPPNPFPTPFPSGGPLSPPELGEVESTMDSYAPPGSVFYEDYPLVDFPKAPAPQTPPLPGNPIAGRGTASPQTPKLPNQFGGGR